MNTNVKLAPHEAFELHELLTFKNVCATKASSMSALVNDEELKTIMQQDLTTSQGHIKELEDLIKQSNCYGVIDYAAK